MIERGRYAHALDLLTLSKQNNHNFVLCIFPSNDCNLIISTSRNYPCSPHRRDWNFLGVGGEGFCKTHKFKKKLCEALMEFPVGWEVLEKIPSMGEVWIFSGTTQFMQTVTTCVF